MLKNNIKNFNDNNILYDYEFIENGKEYGFKQVVIEYTTVDYPDVISKYNWILIILLIMPIIFIFIIYFIQWYLFRYIRLPFPLSYLPTYKYTTNTTKISLTATIFTCFLFLWSLLLLVTFDKTNANYQFQINITPINDIPITNSLLIQYLTEIQNIFHQINKLPILNTPNTYYYPHLHFAIDGISIFFIILVTFIFFLCFIFLYQQQYADTINLIILLFIIEEALIITFTTLDLIIFFISFETILIPMYILIGKWGSRTRKIKANYYFFLYTLLGSFLILYAFIIIYIATGTTNMQRLLFIYQIEGSLVNERLQLWLWWLLIIGFGIKIPIFPVHIWLPEAHVEAPTIGSVILASILLKLGGYGLIRFVLILLPQAVTICQPHLLIIAFFSSIYAGLICLAQDDIKKIIAYSSIAHMNYGLIGLMTLKFNGLLGFIMIMLGHGLISAGLFFCVGYLYERYGTRDIKQYGGLAKITPLFYSCLFFLSLANIAFPGTFNFTSEFIIFIMITRQSPIFAIIAGIILFINTIYGLLFLTRICFGSINKTEIINYYDLTQNEFIIFSSLIIIILLGGIFPMFFIEYLETTCRFIMEYYIPKKTGFEGIVPIDGLLAEIFPEWAAKNKTKVNSG